MIAESLRNEKGLFVDKEVITLEETRSTYEKSFARHITIMLLATLISGSLNYFYQLFVGRVLTPIEYGIFGSLFALAYIIAVLAETVQTSTTYFVSRLCGEGKVYKVGCFLREMQKKVILVSVGIFLLFVLFSDLISSFLKINSRNAVIITGSIFLFALILPVYWGAFQGLQKFEALAFTRVLQPALKFALGVAFVILGFGVFGALGAITVSGAVTFIASLVFLRRYAFEWSDIEFQIPERLYTFSLLSMIAIFCLAVPANLDVVLVKHYFSPTEAGLYTAASVLGKIVLFISGSIVAVMFPKVTEMHAQGTDSKKILWKSLVYTTILSGVVAIGYWFFPDFVVTITFGYNYSGAVVILKFYGLVMFLFSLSVVFLRYYLAIYDVRYVYSFIVITFGEILAFMTFHNSIIEVVKVLIVANSVLLIFSFVYMFTTRLGV